MKYTSLENLSWESDTEARSADPDDVIGTVTDLRVEGDRLLFSVVFGSHDLADRCFRVVEKRINACSISFNPIRQHAEGDAVIIDEAELIEISLVIIGSNPEALALRSFIEATNPMCRATPTTPRQRAF